MFSLILLLIVVWFGLTLFLAAATLFLQGWLNESPPTLPEIAIRAPIAGAILAVFITWWTILAYNNPEGYGPLTEFTSRDELPLPEKLWVVKGSQKGEFQMRHRDGKPIYLDAEGSPPISRPDEVILVEDGKEIHFLPRRDESGKFLVERNGWLRYYDDRGRYMVEGFLGQMTVFRGGRTFFYVILNILHGAVWFACMAFVMRFTVAQSIGLSLIFWGIMTFFLLPPILLKARDVAARRARQAVIETPLLASRPEADCCQKARKGEGPTDPLPYFSTMRVVNGQENQASANHSAATVAAMLIVTTVSSPARTATRSVRVW